MFLGTIVTGEFFHAAGSRLLNCNSISLGTLCILSIIDQSRLIFWKQMHMSCWLGSRKGIQPAKTEWWGAGMVICLGKVQICIWPSSRHCHSLSLAPVNPD